MLWVVYNEITRKFGQPKSSLPKGYKALLPELQKVVKSSEKAVSNNHTYMHVETWADRNLYIVKNLTIIFDLKSTFD